MPYRRAARAALLGAALLPVALTAAPALAQRLPPVSLATVERGPIVREVALTGSLSSPRRARLAPEVAGRVTAIEAETGERVAAGDALLRLDDELARIELRQAEAARAEAEADLADARRRLREARDLAERGGIGQSELEGRRAEVQRLEAVLTRREAEAAYRAGLVERHTLAAPFAGVINRRMVDLGERATPQAPVFELVATGRLYLELEVPQEHFGAITTGTPVEVRFDARPGHRIEGGVDAVVPVSDSASRTFLARVAVDNADGRLIPGMSARAVLRIDTGREGVLIPQDGLLRYPDGRTVVWVARGEGEQRTVQEVRVQTGLRFGERIAVTAGLEPGAAIVTEGNEALQEGQQVRVAAAD